MATNESYMSTTCTWPRCSCRATGQYCPDKPEKNKPKKRIKPISDKGRLKKEEKKSIILTDGAFYLMIWEEREHKCQNCGAKIFEFALYLFHHILAKRPDGGYPQYRYCKWNIWILCWECHDTHDNGNPDSPKVAKLRTEYHRLLNLHNDGKLQMEHPEGFYATGGIQEHKQDDMD